MSKASAWARQRPKPLDLRARTGTRRWAIYRAFVDETTGGMFLDNAGAFPAREALRLARWIEDVFGVGKAKRQRPRGGKDRA